MASEYAFTRVVVLIIVIVIILFAFLLIDRIDQVKEILVNLFNLR